MTLPSLPSQGSTNWYDHYQALHEAVEGGTGASDSSVAALVADTESDTGAALRVAFGPLPDAFLDPRIPADGAITGLTRGTFTSSFGNSPAVIANDAIEHTPVPATNAAAYVQGQLSEDVARIGCIADWGDAATGAVALVIPDSPWSNASIGDAGLHLVVSQNGNVALGRYQGTTTNVTISNVGTLRGAHVIEAVMDYRRSYISVYFDGARVIHRQDTTAFTLLSPYAIWELYEQTNAEIPARFLSVWANGESRIPAAVPLLSHLPRPATSTVSNSVNPGSTATYNIGTAYANIDSSLSITVTYPASGKLLVSLSTYVLSATAAVFFRPRSNAAAVRMNDGTFTGRVTAEVELTGTAYATETLTWQAQTTSGTPTLKVGGGYGPTLLRATPST